MKISERERKSGMEISRWRKYQHINMSFIKAKRTSKKWWEYCAFAHFAKAFLIPIIFFFSILSHRGWKKAARINEFHFNLIFFFVFKKRILTSQPLSIVLTCSEFNAIAFTLANELNNKEDGNGIAIVNFLFEFTHKKKSADEKKIPFSDDVMRALSIVRKCLDKRWKHSRAKVKFGQFFEWEFWCWM